MKNLLKDDLYQIWTKLASGSVQEDEIDMSEILQTSVNVAAALGKKPPSHLDR